MTLVNLENVQTDERTTYDLIPDGTHTFSCVESKLKTTKGGDGQFIEITLECLDDPYKKRRVWARFNIRNKSMKAESIGKTQLKRFLEAAGRDSSQLSNASELIGTVVKAVIGSEHTPPYSKQNIVKKWIKTEEPKAF